MLHSVWELYFDLSLFLCMLLGVFYIFCTVCSPENLVERSLVGMKCTTYKVFMQNKSMEFWFHPSIFYRLIRRSGCGGAGAYPSSLRAIGRVRPGQVASPSQGVLISALSNLSWSINYQKKNTKRGWGSNQDNINNSGEIRLWSSLLYLILSIRRTVCFLCMLTCSFHTVYS